MAHSIARRARFVVRISGLAAEYHPLIRGAAYADVVGVVHGVLAESEGFEPPSPFGLAVFKTAAFDRSANSPGGIVKAPLGKVGRSGGG